MGDQVKGEALDFLPLPRSASPYGPGLLVSRPSVPHGLRLSRYIGAIAGQHHDRAPVLACRDRCHGGPNLLGFQPDIGQSTTPASLTLLGGNALLCAGVGHRPGLAALQGIALFLLGLLGVLCYVG